MDIPDIFPIYVSIRGKNWGEDGFIRIQMLDHWSGTCGINEEAEYAEWKDMY